MSDQQTEQRPTAPTPAERSILTHCLTCGKPFDGVKYKCPICGEYQCSDVCRDKHFQDMN